MILIAVTCIKYLPSAVFQTLSRYCFGPPAGFLPLFGI